MLLNPVDSVLMCDNCLTEVKCDMHLDLDDKAPTPWQTTWLFIDPLDEEHTHVEGRVDACSDYCRHELEADGIWA